MTARRILVIADDVAERAAIARTLQSAGYLVELAEAAKRALRLVKDRKFEAAIVALSASTQRETIQRETIVRDLSGSVANVIVLVDPGKLNVRPDPVLFPADAILVRPLDQKQLLTRIAESKDSSHQAPTDVELVTFAFDGCTFDVAGRIFVDTNGRETPLTRSEADLLTILVRSPRRVFMRDRLRRAVTGRRLEPYDRSLDILVARLRRKVEPDPKFPRFILTVSGAGYKFGPLPRTEMKLISPLHSAGILKLEDSSFALPSNDRHPRTVAPDFAALTLPSEKRQLTVLCCGLANTAGQFAKGDLEGVEHSIGVLRHTASEVVARLGGSIVRAAGEEILAVFGYPQAHEDDAERAVATGLDLLDRLAEIRSATGADLHAQLVIATGQVLVSDDSQIIGAPLMIAERLRVSARINTVEVTAATQKLIHRAFELDNPLSRQIEDVPRPMITYRVVSRRAAKTRFRSLRDNRLTPFVGRQKELEQLRSLWERARAADGKVALICGEPGIGKSRMFQALLDRVEDEQVGVILCQCSPHHLNAPYHPIIRYLEDAAGFDRGDSPNTKLEKLKAAVSITNCVSSPDLVLFSALLSISVTGLDPLQGVTPRRQRELTNAMLVQHFLAVARRQPLIIKLADAHWANSSTLDLFGAVIASMSSDRVLIVVTCRPEFFTPWLEHSQVTTLGLRRLQREEARKLVMHVARETLSERICDQIVIKSDGVPLFAEELTKSFVEFKSRTSVDGPYLDSGIPETLADLLAARLDMVGDAKWVAQVGSVIGREFSYKLLAEVIRLPATSLHSALAQLAAHELIFTRGELPEIYLCLQTCAGAGGGLLDVASQQEAQTS